MKGLIKSVNFILILHFVLHWDNIQAGVLHNSHYVVNSPIKVFPFYNDVSSSPHQYHHRHQYQQPLVEKNVQRSPYIYQTNPYQNIQPLYFTSNMIPYSQGGYQFGPQQYQQDYRLNYRENGLTNDNNNVLSQYTVNQPQPSFNNNQFQQIPTRGTVSPPIAFQNQNNINQNVPYQNQYSSGSVQSQTPSTYTVPTPAGPVTIQPNFIQSPTIQYNNNNNEFLHGGFDQSLNHYNNYGNFHNNNDNFQYSGATFSAGPSNFGYEVSGPGVLSQYQFNQSPGPSAPSLVQPPSQFGFSSASVPNSSGPSAPGNYPQSASSNTASVVEQFQALDKTQEFQDLINENILRKQAQKTEGGYSDVVVVSPKGSVKSSSTGSSKENINSSQTQNNSQRGISKSATTTTTTTKRPKTTEKKKPVTTSTTSSPLTTSETHAFGQRLSPIKSIRNQNKNSVVKTYLPPQN